MILIGHGQLKHHFWGDYHATIVVRFHDEATTKAARFLALPMFELVEPQASTTSTTAVFLRFHGTGAALKAAEAALVAAGANRDKLTSVAKSIDYGEPFTVQVDTTPAPTETQAQLFD